MDGEAPTAPSVLEAEVVSEAPFDPGAPATLPPLAHRSVLLDLDYTGAGIAGDAGSTFAILARVAGEAPVYEDRWHAGFAWDFVSAAAAGEGRALVYGNPEVWLRGVNLHESGLGAGGGLGVVVPLPRQSSARELGVVDNIRVLRPWDTGTWKSDMLTFRPSFDLRYLVEPFNLQVRQGLDWSYDFEADRSDVVARIGTYAGVDLVKSITAGVELWQTYSITADVEDNQRAAFTLSPLIRFRVAPIEPGLSLLFPLSTPLEGIATGYFAVRIHVRMALGKTTAVTYAP